jgi:hypothetical protein
VMLECVGLAEVLERKRGTRHLTGKAESSSAKKKRMWEKLSESHFAYD